MFISLLIFDTNRLLSLTFTPITAHRWPALGTSRIRNLEIHQVQFTILKTKLHNGKSGMSRCSWRLEGRQPLSRHACLPCGSAHPGFGRLTVVVSSRNAFQIQQNLAWLGECRGWCSNLPDAIGYFVRSGSGEDGKKGVTGTGARCLEGYVPQQGVPPPPRADCRIARLRTRWRRVTE